MGAPARGAQHHWSLRTVVARGVARGRALTTTRHARVNEALASSAFLDSVIENIPHMVAVKDAKDLRFVRLNRAASDFIGYTEAEVIGLRSEDIFPRGDADRFTIRDREVLERGHPVDLPAEEMPTGSHGVRILHTRKIPIFDRPGGEPLFLLTISEDVTERTQSQALLGAARSAAERANRAKNEFLSRMSHELRTPLNAILGFGKLLELDEISGEQRENVAQITGAGRHLLALIDEVLDIARVETGDLRLSEEPIRLSDVVAEAVSMVGPAAAVRDIQIERQAYVEGDVYVMADKQRLKQVLLNVLSNAIKYNCDRGLIEIDSAPSAEGFVRLVVRDTGAGMSADQLSRLFVPFERLGAGQSDVEGTGLGLALSRHLVEAMGGRMGAESAVGVGSEFWVELRWAEAPIEESIPPTTAVRVATPRTIARRVLCVEDNESNIKLVQRILAHRPEITVIVAVDGHQALERARSERPSLVLLDLHLPDMPGAEILRQLLADPATASIPVVILSADATPGQRQRLRDAGAADYLTKPIDVGRLLSIVDGTATPWSSDDTHAPEPPGPLDPTMIRALHELGSASDGRNSMSGLVHVFLDGARTRMRDMRLAAESGDTSRVAAIAHSLAGSSANYGAHLVARTCRRIMTLAMDESGSAFGAVLAELDADFDDAERALTIEFRLASAKGTP